MTRNMHRKVVRGRVKRREKAKVSSFHLSDKKNEIIFRRL